jgi:radical SAM superfamily enzyme YgiQ (UPF0313 family)
MRICLVRPASVTTAEGVVHDGSPPVGLAYLAAVIRECGHEVSVVDAVGEALTRYSRVPGLPTALHHGLSDAETVSRIPAGVDLIGVSVMFSLEWPTARDLMLAIRERFPDATLVAGGEHITAVPEFSLADCPALDLCVLGEGEETVADLVEALDRGGDLRQVGGLCLRVADGATERTGARPRIRQLESLPRPDWSAFPIANYLDLCVSTGIGKGRSMPMLASRGCPYRCTFCSNPAMWGTLWRARPVDDVVDEIADYVERFGITNVDFFDLTAIVKRSWILEFSRKLRERGLDITWQMPSGTRSEALDQEVTALLKEAGCRYITYAPESGSDETLRRIKKQIDKERMLASMRAAVANGVVVKANIILGFPGESLLRVLETYRYILRMAVAGVHDVACFPFAAYPGSELYAQLRERGEITLDDDYFNSLAQYTDPRYMRSYSDRFSTRQIRFLCLAGMALFYGTTFLLKPLRLVRLVRSVLRKTPTTRLSSALIRVLEKRQQLRHVT